MAQAAAPLMVASAGASLFGGFAEARGMDAQAKAAEYRAKGLKLQGRQVGAERARDLNQVLSTIDAIRAGRNVSLDSPTAMVIERANKNRSDAIGNAEQLEIAQGITSEKYSASQLRKGKKFAVIGGFAQAASSLASAATMGK